MWRVHQFLQPLNRYRLSAATLHPLPPRWPPFLFPTLFKPPHKTHLCSHRQASLNQSKRLPRLLPRHQPTCLKMKPVRLQKSRSWNSRPSCNQSPHTRPMHSNPSLLTRPIPSPGPKWFPRFIMPPQWNEAVPSLRVARHLLGLSYRAVRTKRTESHWSVRLKVMQTNVVVC